MELSLSKKSYLGVDLGTSAIKIVELQNKSGRAMLVTYGYVEQSTDIVRASSDEMEERIVGILKSICKKSRVTSKKVVAALPSFSVFTSIISLPAMKKKDIGQAIGWEAKKFVPLPIEDMILDWKIINPAAKKNNKPKQPQSVVKFNSTVLDNYNSRYGFDQKSRNEDVSNYMEEKHGFISRFFRKDKNQTSADREEDKHTGNLSVLLTAAPKTLVERYLRIFKRAELEIISLETEAFALERSLAGGDTAPMMIIDIGSISSDITIINGGIPILNRSIDVGGVTITKSLMSSLNVDITRAEQFKRDIGFSSLSGESLPAIIKNTINPIINEVKYSLDIYLSQADKNNIEKIVLTGGSAWLPELPKYLSKLLNTRVIIGDPWDRIIYPMDLKPILNELGPRFSIAIGLAMREL
ncbi:hypothetical protein COV56_02325 [Candidatus Kuenenbacteria bacterium CG11_big_fil_rev_8_21_14_0_20_37_9]|uniref:SHS2 domain-containing protein n=2 Tax=Candidatus Kueneniibacteriota TaxID=1752740 RepID=A0A2M6XT43_9BACT|nr:MAG: hypothetical protein AUJ29_01570 [Candidatus Kuenenbacteria bacterium CG1_02_38_13]PIR05529.1 MAG: hypothetical protein COV56_02325 [Candidatus Kuenenbacteria bacterium CG11_big_fil_rev_8_21_14_0_20_37_9]PIU10810.1 MAG: hypothetical protein COT27_01080 [Candidatus Kuenenbacteria bacterium CG08_land_8_20_14_0_20_37_23]